MVVTQYKLDNGGSLLMLLLKCWWWGSNDACLIQTQEDLNGSFKPGISWDGIVDPNKRYCYEFDGGFMGYHGQSSYEILSITDNRMTVRFYKRKRFSLLYIDFTTTKPTQAVADYTTLKRLSLILMEHLIQPNGLMT
jgi:hypothetical protein